MERCAKMSSEFTVYCDVDRTLITKFSKGYEKTYHLSTELFPNQIKISGELEHLNGTYEIHMGNVNILKEYKARGYSIIIWSARGSSWAAKTADAVGLSEVADFYLAKPTKYIDDKHASEFMGEPLFFTEEDL